MFNFILLVSFLAFSLPAYSGKYQGRVSTGAFLSRETINDPNQSVGSAYDNDFLIYTGRLYLSAQELTSQQLDSTIDIRDKYNSFEVLDKRSKTLSGKHTFQVRQMTFGNSLSRNSLQFRAGRFQILQGAYSYVDGLNLQKKIGTHIVGTYGGYNPVLLGQNYLDFNEKAQTYGVFYSYLPTTRSWTNHFQSSTAFSQNTFDGQADRTFVYQNSLYQWQTGGYAWAQFYLDFIPRTYVQNGIVLIRQPLTNTWTGQLGFRAYDVIQYRRVQNIRERLAPSPYNEASIKSSYRFVPGLMWDFDAITGKRNIDHYNYHKIQNSLSFPRLFSKEFDGSLFHFWRQSFTNVGHFFGLNLGYFKSHLEYAFVSSYGIEKQTDDSILRPLIFEGSMAFHFSKTLFSSFSVQSAHDEKADILSLFFKLTYRFGNTQIAPIRDSAAPRGRL